MDIRGNVDTRLRKLASGTYDAIVVAACGVMRLGFADRITQVLPMEIMLPEPGQGAIAIQMRREDLQTFQEIEALEDVPLRACVDAERAVLAALGGGCHVPIAAYADMREQHLHLEAAVLAPDGSQHIREQATGSPQHPETLGTELATRLIQQGAHELLSRL